jgi:hypothetical protein
MHESDDCNIEGNPSTAAGDLLYMTCTESTNRHMHNSYTAMCHVYKATYQEHLLHAYCKHVWR